MFYRHIQPTAVKIAGEYAGPRHPNSHKLQMRLPTRPENIPIIGHSIKTIDKERNAHPTKTT